MARRRYRRRAASRARSGAEARQGSRPSCTRRRSARAGGRRAVLPARHRRDRRPRARHRALSCARPGSWVRRSTTPARRPAVSPKGPLLILMCAALRSIHEPHHVERFDHVTGMIGTVAFGHSTPRNIRFQPLSSPRSMRPRGGSEGIDSTPCDALSRAPDRFSRCRGRKHPSAAPPAPDRLCSGPRCPIPIISSHSLGT